MRRGGITGAGENRVRWSCEAEESVLRGDEDLLI